MSERGCEQIEIAQICHSSIITEYQIPLPLSVDEYHLAQLYGVAEASKNETGGGDGIEVLINREIAPSEPYYDEKNIGQYTHKRFHLSSKIPSFVRHLAPNNSLEVDEKAWNCYPYCRTEYSNRYMKDSFHIVIESWHKKEIGLDNVHELSDEEKRKRTVQVIDIANDICDTRDYKEEEDPKKFKSDKTHRGPLGEDWITSYPKGEPRMCCYKLYRVLFKWKLIQNRVENTIMKSVKKLLFNFHRQIFCWIDKWYGMNVEDIRDLEDQTKKDLDEMRKGGEVKGMTAKE